MTELHSIEVPAGTDADTRVPVPTLPGAGENTWVRGARG
jgi:hypothetical protein